MEYLKNYILKISIKLIKSSFECFWGLKRLKRLFQIFQDFFSVFRFFKVDLWIDILFQIIIFTRWIEEKDNNREKKPTHDFNTRLIVSIIKIEFLCHVKFVMKILTKYLFSI